MPHSGVLAWLVKLVKMKPNIHIVEFRPPTGLNRPVVFPIMCISSSLIKSAPLVWKSWVWQCTHADSRGNIKPGVRPVVLGTVDNDVGVVASTEAWW